MLRSCVFSPTGLNILAQGKAKRRPGYATARNAHCPEGAEQTVPTHTTDANEFCPFRAISRWRTPYPGRRCATNILLPHSGRITKAQRISGTKSQENELLKNSQTGLCRTAQAEPVIQWNPRQSLGTSWWRSARLCLPSLRLFALGPRCVARQSLGCATNSSLSGIP